MTLPRMKSTVTHIGLLDHLQLEWEDRRLVTTAQRGAFTPEVIREWKRKFAHIPRDKK